MKLLRFLPYICGVLFTSGVSAEFGDELTPENVVGAITRRYLEGLLTGFDNIAKRHGNRAAGYPGYKATSDWLLKIIEYDGLFTNAVNVWVQPFNYTFRSWNRDMNMTWEEPKTSWNLIVETKEGDPDNVVMLGAHLDSVPSGAGLNDNGSGVAAVFKIIHSIARHKGIKNKVRAAFLGGRRTRLGLHGSFYYASTLTPEQADRIRVYFNYDMIASENPQYTVLANSGGEKAGGSVLLDYLKHHGKEPILRLGITEPGHPPQLYP